MDTESRKVQALKPDVEVMTRQRLPYFIGISGQTVGAQGLSMHLVVIPPGGRAEPHIHLGYETGIYVLEGRVCTRWGPSLENETISEPGEFLFVPPGVPHEAINLSATEPARAVVARNDPAEQEKVVPYGAANQVTSGVPMNEPGSRLWKIFLEVYEDLPRQGPGNRASAARALGLCRDLPPAPAILDLGCGVGGQTLHLADLTSGTIVAMDRHAPSIERLKTTLARRGLSERVQALVGDMAHPEQPPESFDLIWAEGALYFIGIENALKICHGLLRPGGHLAFSDAVWRKENPPPEIKAGFDLDYPAMGRVEDVLAAIDRGGFEQLGHFALPDEAWWTDFYTPMEKQIAELRARHADDDEAMAILDQLAQEPEMHRRHSDYYAYEFFVGRRR